MVSKTVVVLGTATPGGGFPAYGAPYAETLNEMDPTLSVQTRNTKGSTIRCYWRNFFTKT